MWKPESVIKEIDFLVETYGVRNIKFVDEMFVLNKSHVLGTDCRLAQQERFVLVGYRRGEILDNHTREDQPDDRFV